MLSPALLPDKDGLARLPFNPLSLQTGDFLSLSGGRGQADRFGILQVGLN